MEDFMQNLRFKAHTNQNGNHNKPSAVFDGLEYRAEDDMAATELAVLKIDVGGLVAAWTETDEAELDEGETLADRFDAMMVGLVDADKNGELSDDELSVLDIAYNVAYDVLTSRGASHDDAIALINEADETAAENIHELLINTGADGEEAELAAINAAAFEFDEDSDSAVMDATYKRAVAIRNGKKVIVRKRIAGTVRLTAKQKAAIKKMQRKAHSGAARAKRLKSLKRRKAMGL